MNNTIGDYEVNITWHHVDGESNRTRIYELAKQLYFGNWTINYFKNDPHPHACDVIFFAWTSSLLPSLLYGLKDFGLRLPVYSYGTNGLTAFMNTSVTPWVPLWDNVVTAETMCDKEIVGILKWLNLEGAKTIFLLWESDAGAYIDSLVSGVRADSAKYGWEIKFDEASAPARDKLIGKLRNHGVQVGGCGDAAIRFRPALIFQPNHVDVFLNIFEDVLLHDK